MKRYYKILASLFLLNMAMGGVGAYAQTVVEKPSCCTHTTTSDNLSGGTWWNTFSPFYLLNAGESIVFSFQQQSIPSYPNNYQYGWTWVLYANDVAAHNGDSENENNLGGLIHELVHIQPDGRNVDGGSYGDAVTTNLGNNDLTNFIKQGGNVVVRVSLLNGGQILKIYITLENSSSNYYVSYIKDIADVVADAETRNNVEHGTSTYKIGDPLYLFFALQNTTLDNFTASYSKWAIFDETTMSPSTWNGVSVYNDIETPMSSNKTTGWVPRGTVSYKRIEALNDEQIVVNGKTLFPSVYFTADANTYNGDDSNTNNDNYKDKKNTGSFEISPRMYRILLNNQGSKPSGGNYSSYFTLKNVPVGSYIWIEALTNETGKNAKGVYFNVTGQNGGTATRYDDNTGGGEEETEKHMFCYRVNKTDDYKITPSRACYIYYIAVKTNPLPVLKIDNPKYPNTDSNPETVINSTFQYNLSCNVNDKTPYSYDKNNITYSSDDITVATVDANGTVTIKGQGRVAITATLPAGSKYTVASDADDDAGREFVLDYDVSVSDTINVVDSRVITPQVLDKNYTPQLWESWDCVKDKETLIKMYFGGWKYQKVEVTSNDNASKQETKRLQTSQLADLYLKTVEGYTGDSKARTDKYSTSGTWVAGQDDVKEYSGVPMDGFGPYASGTDNGKSEFLFTSKLWESDYMETFSTRGGDGINGKGNPFTVPCMGDFVKFEPECNGTVTLYVMQNGCIDSNDNYQLVGKIAWRPVYIIDEAGNCLPEEDVTAITKQRTLFSRTDQTSDVYDADKDDANYVDLPFSEAITTLSEEDKTTGKNIYETHKAVFDDPECWSRRGTYEHVLGPSITNRTPEGADFTVQTGGWVVISKGYVKYQFPVKAGKSYYVFSNKAKLGICGYSFLPDESGNNVVESCTLNANDGSSKDIDELAKNLGKTVKSVTVNHNFHAGWNSICLPFSITESKMRAIFGKEKVTSGPLNGQKKEDYELVIFNGSKDLEGNNDKVYFFHHVYQDIIAGYPYMIYIDKDADIIKNGENSFTVKDVTIENVKSGKDDISITTSDQYMPKNSGFEDLALGKDFTFKGVYEPTDVPEGSYLVVANGIQIYRNTTLPGYRAYLHPSYADKPQQEVKRITAHNLEELGYIWDEANSIEGIMDEDGANGTMLPANVYHVSGMLVREGTTSLDGLPKGVYIVNGKKYLVK